MVRIPPSTTIVPDATSYPYTKLQESQIRLLRLHGRLTRLGVSTCHLITCSLQDAPAYIVIIYCEAPGDRILPLKIDGHTVQVPRSLKRVLRCQCPTNEQNKLLWVEELCVDQNNSEKELALVQKNHIFSRAAKVVRYRSRGNEEAQSPSNAQGAAQKDRGRPTIVRRAVDAEGIGLSNVMSTLPAFGLGQPSSALCRTSSGVDMPLDPSRARHRVAEQSLGSGNTTHGSQLLSHSAEGTGRAGSEESTRVQSLPPSSQRPPLHISAPSENGRALDAEHSPGAGIRLDLASAQGQETSPETIPAITPGNLPYWLRPTVCTAYIGLYLAVLAASLAVSLWGTLVKDDMSGGFTVGTYMVGVGFPLVRAMQLRHQAQCRCRQTVATQTAHES